MTDFDDYASDYRRTLDRGLSISGENGEHFARRRVEWLAERLERIGRKPRRILDLGCGEGTTAPLLLNAFDAEHVLGVDPSPSSVELANRLFAGEKVEFEILGSFRPCADRELVYCNGVLHHVAPAERRAVLESGRDALAPGGLFALWENNPWNPGARWIMWRLPFDRDALPLSVREARRLVADAGLEVVRVDFLFVFPRMLAALRKAEPWLARYPIGAQYLVLCRKP